MRGRNIEADALHFSGRVIQRLDGGVLYGAGYSPPLSLQQIRESLDVFFGASAIADIRKLARYEEEREEYAKAIHVLIALKYPADPWGWDRQTAKSTNFGKIYGKTYNTTVQGTGRG